ncbi:cytochrome c biogenesis protein [Novimethylophilus kurashikiensis]|uniref:Cytochrome c biogenesis protein n=2 Tax=Novimethylophilus kurashikiensis TaxID=1825523 RepID=A0A2R5F5B8_9PROT|nr:cytochrome c biogenesis protein [Novimethylophilus kurashikiensis]
MKNHTHSRLREIYDLLSSMRFAVSLLTVLGIASIIGTVLKQNEPYPNYIIQFGQFWFSAFEKLGLYDVYHSGWFIVILAFLVISTALCVYRNTPLMLREIRSWREHATEKSLRLFSHQAEYATTLTKEESLPKLQGFLTAHGFRFKTVDREAGDVLIAAKAGAYQRLGYILTHAAIIVICIGGLIDGNLPFKFQEIMGWKKIETRDLAADKVPAISRLPVNNLSFRGNITIPEGSQGDVVFLRMRDGYLVQELPFAIALKKFRIEHYPTGQPKSFESDVAILDPDRKEPFNATISVNHPLIYKGVAIYQSDFQDGGSSLSFDGWQLASAEARPFKVDGKVNGTVTLTTSGAPLTVELDDFRLFNVLNLSSDGKGKPHNVGPSVTFKVRDAQGQAHEYLNYMQPMQLDGRTYFVSGMRGSPSESFRYLRIPADEDVSIQGYMQWHALMSDPAKAPILAKRLADKVLQGEAGAEAMRPKFINSVQQLLGLFAKGGFNAVADFIEKSVPANEREKAAQTYIRILENVAFEAYGMSREADGKPAPKTDEATLAFIRDSLNSASDVFFYGSPFFLQLTSFEHRQASGFQLTRSPGKNLVYGGSILLVLGIFAMFYVRERRVWLLVKPGTQRVLFAMSSARKSRDFDAEFERFKGRLQQLMQQ